MAVLIAFLLGENSPFVGGPFHVADTVHRFSTKLVPTACTAFRFTYSVPRITYSVPRITNSILAWLRFTYSTSHLACSALTLLTLMSLFSDVSDISDVR